MPKLHEGRRYDLWWENPLKRPDLLVDSGECQVILNYLKLHKRGMTARQFMQMHFHGMPWKCYVMDKYNCYLIDYTCEDKEIRGSWPVWDFRTSSFQDLKELIEVPWDRRPIHINAQWWEIPVEGQQHRVFCYSVPAERFNQLIVNRRIRLSKVQRLYPEVELFLRMKYMSIPLAFAAGFSACSIALEDTASLKHSSIFLPNGKEVRLPEIERYKQYIEYFGFDINEVRNNHDEQMLYNIASVRYAAHHWDDPTGPYAPEKGRFVKTNPEYNQPDMYAPMPSYQNNKMFNGKYDKMKDTDKILCDSCALWRLCPAYRAEAVCGLPGTESKKLADLALSRNADDVVSMLASIVSKQAERVEARIEDEQLAPGGHDKEIDKMLNNTFRNGVQLAKLRDPSLGRPLVQVNVAQNPNTKAIASADPRVIAAGVIAELESSGVRREDITESMINDYLTQFAPPQLEPYTDAEVVDEQESSS